MTKRSSIRRGSFGRGLAVSLAGIRAGGAFAIGSAVGRLRGDDSGNSELMRREARRFTAELGRLKGTYVKIGQMMALLGEHFLPEPLTDALHDLDSQTHPLPWAELEPSVRDSLGARYRELQIDTEPLAAASLAQVHHATRLSDGYELVLKVQYPGLAAVIDDDFDAVVRMLLLTRWIKAGREIDAWFEDMREQLHHEIDYLREKNMTREARKRFAASDCYHVPEVVDDFCSDSILALEYVHGHRVTQPEVAALSQSRRNALGQAMLELFFIELYEWGVLQTDPNFGNYLIHSEATVDRLVLLDFGSTLACDDDFRRHFGDAIAAGQTGDRELLADSLVGLGCLKADATEFARESFCEFCEMLLEPLANPENLPAEYLNAKGQYCWGRSRLMQRVGKHAASSAATRHFATPSRDFALIVRKLTGVFTFITVLNAEFNGHEIAHRYIDGWIGGGSEQ
ncbi:AarF/ABC1/UbiB kinase family protein [Congregibacter variabilis]|uniref:AarF/ABC1/UbiB kinase family protein n=1 Tax=Congregibacter variabilis TaxID=3081200 RepID=A0ABZ0I2J0_9GAMM|nr:AarF/ABC1/UbiB kinase family protein [Congregibacter sp. IMCC43200]